jgi:hypothetical protein
LEKGEILSICKPRQLPLTTKFLFAAKFIFSAKFRKRKGGVEISPLANEYLYQTTENR